MWFILFTLLHYITFFITFSNFSRNNIIKKCFKYYIVAWCCKKSVKSLYLSIVKISISNKQCDNTTYTIQISNNLHLFGFINSTFLELADLMSLLSDTKFPVAINMSGNPGENVSFCSNITRVSSCWLDVNIWININLAHDRSTLVTFWLIVPSIASISYCIEVMCKLGRKQNPHEAVD